MKSCLLSIALLFAFVCCFAQSEIPLEQKRFSKNWFSDVDKAKANKDSVFYLDLSLRKLKTFPIEIFELKNLKELYLSYNYWETIPEGLASLKNLVILDLSGNYYLNVLPKDLKDAKTLKQLVLKDNKLNKGEVDKVKTVLSNTTVEISEHK